ncbi:septum-promoting GTP-binding protein 1-like [Hibiscus syriacus]|uniref:septum-promoting GTP-binding protein 1-like n=1 Tax=Hibiscus syriacus TaxID=106335 RepID=UPI001923D136|nr:septum-promoting GTP-binding protein 1-like [Hibiscus syriacus]
MTQLCRKTVRVNTKWIVLERVSVFRRIFSFIWDKVVVCSLGRPIQYRRLTRLESSSSLPSSSYSLVEVVAVDDDKALPEGYEVDSDLVSLKISLLGDCQIGKTGFLVSKYVGDEQEKILQMTVLNLANKTLFVQGAKISFSIWDVGGDSNSLHHLPIACKNAVAIMFMFDLTSRCTLNSVVGWYSQARNWNQTAIPIIIGTKFDDFVGLPPDVQWTIVTQARAYAKAMNATLFFSSATHNINVNKIFKFIMAKLVNLPCTIERNLNIGEPIIDF